MEWLDLLYAKSDTLSLAALLIYVILKAVAMKLNLTQALQLAINVLKDEDKQVDDEFTNATVDKVDAVAAEIKADVKAVTAVKEALDKSSAKGGTKIASIGGKPIYAEDVASRITRIKALVDLLRR